MTFLTCVAALAIYLLAFVSIPVWVVIDARRKNRDYKRPLFKAIGGCVALGFVLCLVGYFLIHRNPLPKDEELLALFNSHRVDIEELVRRYRTDGGAKNGKQTTWDTDGDTPELLKRARIKRIQYNIGMWFPDPYSIETAKKIAALVKNGTLLDVGYHYGTTQVSPADPRYFRLGVSAPLKTGGSLKLRAVFKDLIFIPEVPKVENGFLIGPTQINGKPEFKKPVFESLDSYPENWQSGTCVYRQIEPQWFIRMCNS